MGDAWYRSHGCLQNNKNGNNCIFTCTDYFTKWVEAFPIPNKAAGDVAMCLVKIFCRHGLQMKVLTDQGREFSNEVSCI